MMNNMLIFNILNKIYRSKLCTTSKNIILKMRYNSRNVGVFAHIPRVITIWMHYLQDEPVCHI